MEPVCVEDLEHCGTGLDPLASAFFQSGSDEEITLQRNREAFRKIFIRPRAMSRDVSKQDLSSSLLGGSCPMGIPIGASPSALHLLAHPAAEIATAKGCAAMNSLMTVSGWSSETIEAISTAVGPNANLWQNAYIFKDRSKTLELAKRTERAGCKALVISCDIPVLGKRRKYNHEKLLQLFIDKIGDRWLANIPKEGYEDFAAGDPAATWTDFEDVCRYTRLPVIAKGIVNGADARLAMTHGASAIFVSTHGGRQLDGQLSSIECLPEVVCQVNGECDVYLDSGVRTGADVFKAVALGAKAVFLGRPIIWGLAYAGAEGVEKVLRMISEELGTTMALAGCNSVSEILSTHVTTEFSKL